MNCLSTYNTLLAIFLSLGLPLFARNGFTEQKTGMTGSMRGLDVVSKKVVWISCTNGSCYIATGKGTIWLAGNKGKVVSLKRRKYVVRLMGYNRCTAADLLREDW
ncbi:MAG: hypothetical protein WC865_09650 [Bacteroidales bacterium]